MFNISFSLSKEIEDKLITFFGDCVDTSQLNVRLLNSTTVHYLPYVDNFHRQPNRIENLFSEYNANEQTIDIFLNAIYDFSKKVRRSYTSLLKVILYYEIGKFTFHKYKFENDQLTDIQFFNIDINLKNLISLSIAYNCLKNERVDLTTLKKLIKSLDNDYIIFNDFINCRYGLSILEIHEINQILRNGITRFYGSKMYDTEFLNPYFDKILNVNPFRIIQLSPVLSDELRNKWQHLITDMSLYY